MDSDLVAVESRLWATADHPWANTGLKPSEFTTPVPGLIFLRYADKRVTDIDAALNSNGIAADAREAKADHLLTHLPGNNSDWRGALLNDDRRRPYRMPPADDANFAWQAAA